MTEPVGTFSIEFSTDENAVEAKSYGKVLANTVVVIDEFANELETGTRLRIRVKAEKKGSFVPELSIEAAGAFVGTMSQLLTPENFYLAKEFATKVIKGVGDCFDFLKKLKGESPKEVKFIGDGNVQVSGENFGTTTITNHIYNITCVNERSRDALSEVFEAIQQDPAVKELSLLDGKRSRIFTAKKKDFPKLAQKQKAPEPKRRPRIIPRAILSLVRVSFEEKKKFDFVYAGNSITASVEDQSFWENLNRREAFAKGDQLVAKLEITQQFNEVLKAYENIAYKVISVIEHRTPLKQPDLFHGDAKPHRRSKSVKKK